MRVRSRVSDDSAKTELDMTPMIDIVFQLLIFFIMTFKIVVQEGDFNIKMPKAAPSQGDPEDLLPPIRVRLVADQQGELTQYVVGDKTFTRQDTPSKTFDPLRAEVIGIVGQDTGPGSLRESAEVEIAADDNLQYRFVIHTITAVSGYQQGSREDRKVVKLVEKIKFAPPAKPAAGGG